MDEVPANSGVVASMSEEEGSGGGGDSSIDRVLSNNQDEEEEEEEEEGSVYGSEDFDDQSKAGGTESEVCLPCSYINTLLPIENDDMQSPQHAESSNMYTHWAM